MDNHNKTKSTWWVEFKQTFGNQLNELVAVEAESRESALEKADMWIDRNRSSNFNIVAVHTEMPKQINNYTVDADYMRPLTTAELIEILKDFAPNTPVLLLDGLFNDMSYGALSKKNLFTENVDSAVFTDFDGYSTIRYDDFGNIGCVVIGYKIDE